MGWVETIAWYVATLPETNSKFAPENRPFAPSIDFSGAFFLAVRFQGPGYLQNLNIAATFSGQSS